MASPLPPDLLAALAANPQGAGPPGPGGPAPDLGPGGPPGGGLPPDLLAALAAGPGPQDQGPAPGAGSDSASVLSDALDSLNQYMQIEPDESDKAVIATCIAQIQKIRAKDQSEQDGMLQGKTTPRGLRKAAAAGGGGGGAPPPGALGY